MKKNERINELVKEARELLRKVRKGVDDSDISLIHLRALVRGGTFTLKDIGTSEEELNKLYKKQYMELARNFLQQMRDGTSRDEGSFAILRKMLRENDLALEDIGTSEEELKEMQNMGHEALAKKHLNRLRDGKGNPAGMRNLILMHVEKGSLTLEDIGTSEEELTRLAIRRRKA